jgi:hypothetical protein
MTTLDHLTVPDRTILLVCDLCDNHTRLPVRHHEVGRYLDQWKLRHDVHHVYLCRNGDVDEPPITDPFGAIPAPCPEWAS